MKIEFELDYKLRASGIRFSKFLIHYLQNDVKELFKTDKVKLRISLFEEILKLNNMVSYKIDSKSICKYVLTAIRYRRLKNTYIIDINPNITLPGTNISVLSILKFINYGNDYVKGCYLFSKLFLHYQKNIINYWRAYFIRSQFS